ncbi:MAG: ABC transporter permease [Desertimonas sp.]
MSSRRGLAAAIVGLSVFALTWELAVRVFDIRPFVLLAPSDIVGELIAEPGRYLRASLVTGRHAVVGLALAVVVAVVIGSLMAASRFLEHAVQPILVLILVAPWVAYFFSVVLWLGRGDPPVIFLVAFVTTPGFVFATVAGLRGADPAARELLRSVDASRVEVLWRLRLPSALPALFATARFSAALALAASYYGEGGNLATVGLGYLGKVAGNAQNAPVLWSTVLATVGLGVVFLTVIAAGERWALRWHASQRGDDVGPLAPGTNRSAS